MLKFGLGEANYEPEHHWFDPWHKQARVVLHSEQVYISDAFRYMPIIKLLNHEILTASSYTLTP